MVITMRKYNSITYGKLTEEEVFQKIKEEIVEKSNEEIIITVGTDSQTHYLTKVVNVIAICYVGKGGKWFDHIHYLKRIDNVRQKVYNETSESIEIGKRLMEFLFDNDLDFQIIIHVDIGESSKGKTKNLIKQIAGWVISEGFEFEYKPNSGTASTIADRISK